MNVVPDRIEPDPAAIGRSQLRAEFVRERAGLTYLHRQFATYPFHICRPLYLDSCSPGFATLYIQSCSGGLYEHEKLSASFVARAGAEVHVTTQAPTVVHTMRGGSAQQNVYVEAHDGAYLEYLPDPQILFPASQCRSVIKVHAAAGATVIVGDSFLNHDPEGAGRMYESYASDVEIHELGGKLLALDRLKLAPGSAHLDCVGTNGSFRAQGTIVVASRDERLPQIVAAVSELGYSYDDIASGASQLPNSAGLIVRVLACDGAMLARAMSDAWVRIRLVLRGAAPGARPK